MLIVVGENHECEEIQGKKESSSSVCAEYIHISLDGESGDNEEKDGMGEYLTNNMLSFNKKEGDYGKNNSNPSHIVDFIKNILNYSSR